MAGLRVVTGGSASGKTERLLGVLSTHYISDPLACSLVLVPTVRHGDQFRRRLVTACGAAFGLEVATMQQWARGYLTRTVPQRGVLASLLERVTSDAIARGEAEHFAPLAGTPGLRRLVERAVTDLLADDVTSDALGHATGADARMLALAAVYRAFRDALDARAWLHPAQLPGAAADALGADAPPPVPSLVVVDGFRVFRRGEIRLLAALARHADVIVAFDATGARATSDLDALRALATVEDETLPPATPSIARYAASAPDREAMLRAIAREVKQVLADNPALRPSDCAVAVRQVGPYLGLARQVFREYDLPLDPAAGVRLGERPLGVWLRRLLHLDEQGWRLRDLVAVLSSAFVDVRRWAVGPRHIALIARLGRRKHLWGGAEAMDALVQALAVVAYNDGADDDGERVLPDFLRDRHREASEGLRTALADLRALLAPPPAPLRVHARALDAALFGTTPLVAPAAPDLVEGAGVEIDALRGCLGSIAAADEALDGAPVPFAAFIARLEHELDAPAVLLREPGGVLLAPLHTLHGLRFTYLAVGGLIEGEFPLRRTTSSLLDREARTHLAAHGLALPPEAHAAEDDLWATASSRADGILSLWRSRLDERGRPAPPSYYFPEDGQPLVAPGSASRREGAIEATSGWRHGRVLRPRAMPAWPVVRHSVEVEQARRSRDGAGRFDGDLPPTALPFVTGAEVRWSATRLETYRTCGFQFFSRYVLRLAELDEEQDGADPATRGSVIHAILDTVTKPLERAGRSLSPETVEEVISRLDVEGRDLWDRAPAEYGFGRAGLWRLEGDETLARIAAMLRAEAAASTPGVDSVESELWVNADLPLAPPMRIGSQIDRLDSGPGLAVVVDYKSGKAITRGDVEAGARLQLQLYAHLARAHTGAERVVARYAFLKPPPRPWDLDTARAEDAQLVEDAIEIADRTRDAVDDGRFFVKPSGTCPRWCAYQHACRRNEWTGTKWPD